MKPISHVEKSYPAVSVYRQSWSGFFAVGFFSFFVNLGALVSPIYMQQIFDRVMQSRHLETLVYMTAVVVFFLAVIALLDGIRGTILAKIARWWDQSVHSDLLVAIIQTARSKGTSHAHAINDLVTIRQFVGGPGVLPFFDGPWMPVFMFAIMMIHPWLGVVAIVAAAFLFIVAGINDRVTRRKLEGLAVRQSRAQTTVDIATRHADSVFSMGMLPGVISRFNEDNDVVADTTYAVGAWTAKLGAISKFVRFTAQIAILGLGAFLATEGEITSGGMIAASIIMGRALAPAEQSLGAWRGLVSAMQAHKRIKELFMSAPTDLERTSQPEVEGKIQFKNATFIIPGMERPILRSVDIEFPSSSAIAIVGPSGSGKSTFCKLLIGSLEPTAGSVRMDGVSMKNWDKTQFGVNVGYLAQTVQLLDGTVKDNICRLHETDDEAVVRAAQLAGCHDMINSFPQGYETVIGSHGMNLSGGQAQRIGFARAIYGNPRLIVLDEPNSNLDAEGDAAFQEAVKKLKNAGTTVIIVSHKPSSLVNVDLIVTIEDGAITKTQTREEFLKGAIKPVSDAINKMRLSKSKKAESS